MSLAPQSLGSRDQHWLSREKAAGYDPEVLLRSRVLLGGAGAGAGNAALALGLSQLGEILLVDFDHYESHNATRSPFYPTIQDIENFGSAKARVVAEKVARLSKTVPGVAGTRARYYTGFLQQLPSAVFGYVDLVLNGADNLAARTFLAEHAFLAGRPFVDAGFRGTLLRVGVFLPRDPIRDPCWRCRHPDYLVGDQRWYSCARFAEQIEAQGLVPAVQASAQVAGALQAAQALQALHGDSPRANSVFSLDIARGDSSTFRAVRNPGCPSRWHHIADRPRQCLPWTPALTWNQLLRSVGEALGTDAQLEPLARIVETMKCVTCQRLMDVHASAWLYEAAPRCEGCGGLFSLLPEDEAAVCAEAAHRFIDFTRVDLLDQTLSAFGVGPSDILLARPFGEPSADPTVVQLEGCVASVTDECFKTVTG